MSHEGLAAAVLSTVPALSVEPAAELCWQTVAHDPVAGIDQPQALLCHDGRWTLTVEGSPVLEIGADVGRVTALQGRDEVVAQRVAAVALPVLARAHGAHVLHAAAMARGRDAVAVVGASGAGKSTLLRAAVDAGWSAVTEDVCVIDRQSDGRLRVWPGPPWLRLDRSTVLPGPWRPRFTTTDKVAWDLRPWLARTPPRLSRVVVLGSPAEQALRWEPVPPRAAIGTLLPHVTWVGSPGARAAEAFDTAVRVARSVEVAHLRVPLHEAWTRQALEAISGS